MKTMIPNLTKLNEFATSFIDTLPVHTNHAQVVILRGNLGAGKTAFVKECAQVLGVDEDITSPTFVIQKNYDISNNRRYHTLVHIDAYRLTNASELNYLKWEELIEDPKNIIFLEWPQMVEGINLPNSTNISLEIGEGKERIITVS
jgi:tRNA threonylcarbamoyladenosine biosynthesis protein TsaE